MRSIEDTVTVMITAVTKRIENTTKQQGQTNLTPQQVTKLKGQREAGEAILIDLVNLSEVLAVSKDTPQNYLVRTLHEWRKQAMNAITSAFTAHTHSADIPFANRYYTALAETYAIVADELSNAVDNREQYDPLDAPAPKKETALGNPLAC